MGRPKGKADKPNRKWLKEEKIILAKRILENHEGYTKISVEKEISCGQLHAWEKAYSYQGEKAFENSYKGGNNPLIKYQNKKSYLKRKN